MYIRSVKNVILCALVGVGVGFVFDMLQDKYILNTVMSHNSTKYAAGFLSAAIVYGIREDLA